MVRSMTGYGRASDTLHNRRITIEVRSVNHRYLDCTVKSPRAYSFLDDAIKSEVSKSVARGKTDVFVTVDSSDAESVKININRPLLSAYLDAIKSLKKNFGMGGKLSVYEALRIPDVISVEKQEIDENEVKADILEVLGKALKNHSEMRVNEGARLADDILSRLDYLEKRTNDVEERSPKCVEEYRIKLETRMKEILDSVAVDPQRILTEAALFADKTAVAEETVRLHSHVSQFRDMINNGGAIGRKLDFLVQELNREVNTIGSKANDLELTSIVVDMKSEIEKIREQVQNIE